MEEYFVLYQETIKFTNVPESMTVSTYKVFDTVNCNHYDGNDPELITIIVWVGNQIITNLPDMCLSIAEWLSCELWS